MKIYVGATFSRYAEARAVMDALARAGHAITFDWTRTDAFGEDGHPLPLTSGGYELDPIDGERYALEDFAAVDACERLLVLAQEPSCGWPIEVGYGLAREKEVWVVAPFRYTVFWDQLNVTTFQRVEDALALLGVKSIAAS